MATPRSGIATQRGVRGLHLSASPSKFTRRNARLPVPRAQSTEQQAGSAPSPLPAEAQSYQSSTSTQQRGAGSTEQNTHDVLSSTDNFFEQELVGTYTLTRNDKRVIKDLTDSIDSCSLAFGAVAVASIALNLVLAKTTGTQIETAEATEMLFNDLPVGDLSSWIDSLLVAGLLRFCSQSFRAAQNNDNRGKQLAYVFQGVDRLGLMFEQFAIAASAVSIVVTLEASSKWPEITSAASGLFFMVALIRCGALTWVLTQHSTSLNDLRTTLGSYRSHTPPVSSSSWPLLDKLAIRVAFSFLLKYGEPVARLDSPTASMSSVSSYDSYDAPSSSSSSSSSSSPQPYSFSQSEEQLLRVATGSLNTAGLALALQTMATVLLVLADVATGEYGDGVGDGIQVINKATAALLLFSASYSFDQALCSDDGSDISHLMNGVGSQGLTKLFHNLSVLAWAVVLAKLASLLMPLEEQSPVMQWLTETFSHRAAHAVLEGEEIVVQLLQ